MRGVLGPLTPKRLAAIERAIDGKVESYESGYNSEGKLFIRMHLLDGDIFEFTSNRTVEWVLEFIKPYYP